MSGELKPCPFCGRKPVIEECGPNTWFVKCKCGIAQDKLYHQRCDAVRRWNKRRLESANETVKTSIDQNAAKELFFDGMESIFGA